jgi:membrane protein required for colicin V production|tara:strand:- start:6620 stop:7114 length:495 start_codon:yes stop_codon:yes gene_type:complete
MNSADWIILGLTSISAIISAIRGAVKEVVSLVVWVLAAIIASIFHDDLAVLMVSLIDTPFLRTLVAWVILFLVCLLTGSLVNYLLGKLVQVSGLSGTDRLLGIIFGVARALIIIMVFLTLTPKIFPATHAQWWIESTFIPYLVPHQDWAQETGSFALNFLKNLF